MRHGKEQSNPFDANICIIGGGVVGLSCGIEFLQAGYPNVNLVAKHFSPDTTSDIAAAVWRPYRMMPEKLAMVWAMESLKVFTQLSKVEKSGVTWIDLTEVYHRHRTQPAWMRHIDSPSTSHTYKHYPCAFRARVPLIDTSYYMDYLMQQFKQLGGKLTQTFIHQLQELKDYACIVNCAGIGNRQLVHDKALFPLKGQIVQVTKPEGVNEAVADYEEERIYIYPRHRDCIIGYTAEENQWELTYDEQAAQALLEKAKRLNPALNAAEIITHKVGFRPARNTVRLEAEPLSMQTLVIHNYGHGGRGFTLSWGCARRVLAIWEAYQ